MTKVKQQWRLGQLERQRKLRRVASMEDLVEGQSLKGPKPRGLIVRFWECVDKRDPDDCWEWKGRPGNHGYGEISACNTYFLAHRISFLIHYGKIDPDLLVMHSCDNPQCVNPAHLSQGTDADNIKDAIARGRFQKGERNGMAKLSEMDVDIIHREYASGAATMKQLANRFGVWVPCIWRIIRRLRWRHL